jgi:hypothetical protein
MSSLVEPSTVMPDFQAFILNRDPGTHKHLQDLTDDPAILIGEIFMAS